MSLEAFREDCLELISGYCARNSTDFQLFCDEWKEKSFHYVFIGFTYQHELLQYTENCFIVLKKIFCNFVSIADRLATLYLMYAMYFKQPTKDFCKFRFSLGDWKKMKAFYDTISTEPKYLQGRAIFWRLWQANAFRFVECDTEQCFESLQSSRFGNDATNNYQKINTTILPTINGLRDESKGLLTAIETLQVGYNEMKEHFAKTTTDMANLKNTNIVGDIVPRIEKIQKLFENNYERDSTKKRAGKPRKQRLSHGSDKCTPTKNENDSASEHDGSISSCSESNDETELMNNKVDDSDESTDGECLNIGSRRFYLRRKAMTKLNEGQHHLKSVLNFSTPTAKESTADARSPVKNKNTEAPMQSTNDDNSFCEPTSSRTSKRRASVISSSDSIVITNPRKVYRRFSKNTSKISKQFNECPPEVSIEVEQSKSRSKMSRKRRKLE